MEQLLRTQFGERLKQVLAARSFKSADLARLTGESPAKVAGWLQGKGLMTQGLTTLATHLDVSVDWLIHGIGPERVSEAVELSSQEEQLVIALRHYGVSAARHLLGLLTTVERDGITTSLQHVRAQALLADLTLPSVILCHHGNFLAANEAFGGLLGFDQEKMDALFGQSYKKWLPHRLRSEFAVLLEQTLMKKSYGINSVTLQISQESNVHYFNIRCRLFSNKDTSGVQFIFFMVKK